MDIEERPGQVEGPALGEVTMAKLQTLVEDSQKPRKYEGAGSGVAELRPTSGAELDLPLPAAPVVVQVTADERDHIAKAAKLLLQEYGSIDAPDFRKMLPACAGRYLPERLYTLLGDFRAAFQRTDYGALIVQRLIDVNQDELGSTPVRWQETESETVKA